MSREECASLLILCGALHDIAEKSKEKYTKRQIEDVEDRIERIAIKFWPFILKDKEDFTTERWQT